MTNQAAVRVDGLLKVFDVPERESGLVAATKSLIRRKTREVRAVDAISFEIPDNLEVGRRDPALLHEDVKRLKTDNVDVVVLSACVQMPSLPSIQAVEDRLGIPVTCTSICTTRRMLDHLGLEPVVPNAGALLSGRYPATPNDALSRAAA